MLAKASYEANSEVTLLLLELSIIIGHQLESQHLYTSLVSTSFNLGSPVVVSSSLC